MARTRLRLDLSISLLGAAYYLVTILSVASYSKNSKRLGDMKTYKFDGKYINPIENILGKSRSKLNTGGSSSKSLKEWLMTTTGKSSKNDENTTPAVEDNTSKKLSSLAQSMLGFNPFAPNNSIDYDALEIPEPVTLIPPQPYGERPPPFLSPSSQIRRKTEANQSLGAIDYDSLTVPEPDRFIKSDTASLRFKDLSFEDMHRRAQFMRINEVKEAILNKLRLLAPPNITALKLNNKLKKYPGHIVPTLPDQESYVQNDARDKASNEDHFHAKIDTVIQFASECKYTDCVYYVSTM